MAWHDERNSFSHWTICPGSHIFTLYCETSVGENTSDTRRTDFGQSMPVCGLVIRCKRLVAFRCRCLNFWDWLKCMTIWKYMTCTSSSCSLLLNFFQVLVFIVLSVYLENFFQFYVYMYFWVFLRCPHIHAFLKIRLTVPQSEGAGWPENVEHMQTSPFPGFMWLSFQ